MPGTGPPGLFLAEASADRSRLAYDEVIEVSRHGRFGNNRNLQAGAQLSQNVIAPRLRRRAHCRRYALFSKLWYYVRSHAESVVLCPGKDQVTGCGSIEYE